MSSGYSELTAVCGTVAAYVVWMAATNKTRGRMRPRCDIVRVQFLHYQAWLWLLVKSSSTFIKSLRGRHVMSHIVDRQARG
jgi:hypothetical protein